MSSLIEGRNAVIEALRAGMSARRVLLAEGIQASDATREIERLAQQRNLTVAHVSRKKLDEQSDRGAHQGVMLEVEPLSFTSLASVIARVGEGRRSLILALDHIEDPGNLGAIARSADVAGADALLVPKRRCAAFGLGAFKSSAGALAHIPVAREPNLVRALGQLKEAGYWIAGADALADTLVWDVALDERLVLVLGAEGSGLSRLVRETCDFLVRLPVAGHVDSLNVAQTATVLAFEWVRQGEAAS